MEFKKTENPKILYQLEVNCFPNPLSFQAIQSYCTGKQYKAFFIYEEAQPISYAITMEIPNDCELIRFGTISQYRRQGKALLFLKKLREHYSERKFQVMFLEVAKANKAGRSLYWKTGFRKYGVRKDYYGKENHAYLLKTKL